MDGPGFQHGMKRDFPGPRFIHLPVQWVPGVFPRGESGQGVALTTHHLLEPWSSMGTAVHQLHVSACLHVTVQLRSLIARPDLGCGTIEKRNIG